MRRRSLLKSNGKSKGYIIQPPTAKTLTYDGTDQDLVNQGSATGIIMYSLDNVNFSNTIPQGKNAASYTVYYYAAESASYTQSDTYTVQCAIDKATGYVATAPTAKSLTYNGSAQALVNAGSGTGTMQYSLDNSSWNVSIPTGTNAGSYTVYYKVAASENYTESSTGSVGITINKASGSVTTAPTNRGVTYNGNNQNLVNAGSGTGTMYYKLNSGSWSTSIPVASGAGSYTVYYYAAASTNYTQSGTGSLTATIGKANQSAPSASGSTVTYGSTAYASASGGGGQGSIEWSNGSSRSAVGSQSTKARWTGNSNYNASGWSSAVTLTVNKASSGVKWTSAPTSVGDGGNQVTAAASRTAGDGSISYSSSNTGIATISSSGVITGKATGHCTITATVASTTNYNASSTSYTLYVNTYVDLGLPSGTKWACRNVGASSETAQGTFYQYGRGTSAYKHGSTYSGTENPLNASKDTARVAWGTSWRSPTQTQIQELMDRTTKSIVTISGRNFLKCSSNGRYILIGVFGFMNGGVHQQDNSGGFYLSCTPGRSSTYMHALWVTTTASSCGVATDKNRTIGMLCRPVLA